MYFRRLWTHLYVIQANVRNYVCLFISVFYLSTRNGEKRWIQKWRFHDHYIYICIQMMWFLQYLIKNNFKIEILSNHKPTHRRIAGGAWGCSSTPKLLEKSEIFRLSEILKRRSEIFITYLYKNALSFFKNVSLYKLRSADCIFQHHEKSYKWRENWHDIQVL